MNKFFFATFLKFVFFLTIALLHLSEAEAQNNNENPSNILNISQFAGSDSIVLLNPFLSIAKKEQPEYTLGTLLKISDWEPWQPASPEKNEKGLLVKFRIKNKTSENIQRILYLHDLQQVTVYSSNQAPQVAGILLPPENRLINKGLILPGIGNSTQVRLDLYPGINDVFLEIDFWVPGLFLPEIRLYPIKTWEETLNKNWVDTMMIQCLILGGLLMMAIYHLLVFVQRRDVAFIWYAIYTSIIIIVLLIESGLFQAYLFPQYPRFNKLLPFLQYHSLSAYVIYWLFLRSYVNLRKLLPRWDKILVWYLIIFFPIGLLSGLLFYLNLNSNDLNLIGWSYAIPIFGLIVGIFYFVIVLRTRNKLVIFFAFGSLILLLGVLINSIISAAISFGWIDDIPFPHFVITEIAIIVEILIFALAMGYRQRLKDEEQQRIKELDSLKSKFFANISHEFRTPLTVISGITEQMTGFENERKLIQRNTGNLLHLVNQLLDLSKLDANALQSKMITSDIIYFLNYITESFYSPAKEKDIRLNFYSEEPSLIMDYDEMKIQQIFNNLLSNAIKFTPEKGQVIIHAKKIESGRSPFLQIKVKDSGIGIAPKDQSLIFDRFYQVDSTMTRPGEGTGIGLALTKELIELLGGTISVQSEVGKWTEFTITLPIQVSPVQDSQAEVADNKVSSEAVVSAAVAQSSMTSGDPQEEMSSTAEAPSELDRLLIIEDNPDIVTYLKGLLKDRFEINVAINGALGIEKAVESIPDIILSDVMMPEKNGYEVCQILKNDERTSHIPIVLLTAKASADDRVEGLSGGADAYLTKPFNKEELFVRLEKLVELRKILQKRYAKVEQISALTKEKTPDTALKPKPNLEDAFLKKIMAVIDKRLDDPKLGVKDLSRAVGVGNMQLNRKLKALTGKTGNVLIRSIRLEKAKELLRTTEYNISEVAYRVGFNDPNYFSRTFSEEFGRPPTDIRK